MIGFLTELEQKRAVGLFHSGALVPSVCSTLLRKDELAERQIQTVRKIRGHVTCTCPLIFSGAGERLPNLIPTTAHFDVNKMGQTFC